MKLRALRNMMQTLLRHEGLILVLAFHTLLRIPNLFEPYWYGDEGIYLTIGTALRNGARLYADIVDHKTPLIYYLAMVPNQFWFRMLLWTWMSVAIVCLFFFLKKMAISRTNRYVTIFLFTLFTALPTLEGNIPNGELFVMGFITVGALLLATTKSFRSFFVSKEKPAVKQETARIILAGVFFGLGILTKVPALFDVAPFLALPFFFLLTTQQVDKSKFSQAAWFLIKLSLGIGLPIVLSVLYYWLRGTLSSYLEFGLLYNFRYANSWGLPTTQPLLLFLLSLKGKALLVIILTGVLILLNKAKRMSFSQLFFFFWFISAFFAALLSSRPYPHYLMQIVLPAAILIGSFISLRQRLLAEKLFGGFLIMLFVSVLLFFNFRTYPTFTYYTRFIGMLTGSLSQEAYENTFDRLVDDNREVATILMNSDDPNLFIWGTNPMLYAQSKKIPTSRFTVSFHIKDIPGSDKETFQKIQAAMPQYIVVMKNEHDRLVGLADLLASEYIPAEQFESMTLYRKR